MWTHVSLHTCCTVFGGLSKTVLGFMMIHIAIHLIDFVVRFCLFIYRVNDFSVVSHPAQSSLQKGIKCNIKSLKITAIQSKNRNTGKEYKAEARRTSKGKGVPESVCSHQEDLLSSPLQPDFSQWWDPKKIPEEDLNICVGTYSIRWSLQYPGPRPYWTLGNNQQLQLGSENYQKLVYFWKAGVAW